MDEMKKKFEEELNNGERQQNDLTEYGGIRKYLKKGSVRYTT